MSNTNKDPTNLSNIPRAGATLPRPPPPAHDRDRDGAQHGPVLPPNPPLPQTGHTMDRAKRPAKYAGPTARPMTTGMLSRSRQEHYLPSEESRDTCAAGTSAHLLQENSNAWDAGAESAHVTCENGARDTFPGAQNVHSVKEREGGLDTDGYSLPPDPRQGHARGHGLATRDPRARWLKPANMGVLRRAQPAVPDGTPRQQSTS